MLSDSVAMWKNGLRDNECMEQIIAMREKIKKEKKLITRSEKNRDQPFATKIDPTAEGRQLQKNSAANPLFNELTRGQ